jgi:hypothetical protein
VHFNPQTLEVCGVGVCSRVERRPQGRPSGDNSHPSRRRREEHLATSSGMWRKNSAIAAQPRAVVARTSVASPEPQASRGTRKPSAHVEQHWRNQLNAEGIKPISLDLFINGKAKSRIGH